MTELEQQLLKALELLSKQQQEQCAALEQQLKNTEQRESNLQRQVELLGTQVFDLSMKLNQLSLK